MGGGNALNCQLISAVAAYSRKLFTGVGRTFNFYRLVCVLRAAPLYYVMDMLT